MQLGLEKINKHLNTYYLIPYYSHNLHYEMTYHDRHRILFKDRHRCVINYNREKPPMVKIIFKDEEYELPVRKFEELATLSLSHEHAEFVVDFILHRDFLLEGNLRRTLLYLSEQEFLDFQDAVVQACLLLEVYTVLEASQRIS